MADTILSPQELQNAKHAFAKVASNKSKLDFWEVREALQLLQQLPAEGLPSTYGFACPLFLCRRICRFVTRCRPWSALILFLSLQ